MTDETAKLSAMREENERQRLAIEEMELQIRQLEVDKKEGSKAPSNTLSFMEAWEEIFEKKISKDKLYAEVRAGRIPHSKIGTKILFRRDTLDAWFKKQEMDSLRK